MPVKIGCLSDTHGFFDDRFTDFLGGCDEVWHAGDIGSVEVAAVLEKIATLKAVYGNIDDASIRRLYPGNQRFNIEGIDVWITHIGGYPGKYHPDIRAEINDSPPGLFICGHSHILKVVNDHSLGLLHINPGAAGRIGIHKVQTAVRFEIDQGSIRNLEVLELRRRRDTRL